MRILKITFENINSIKERHEINLSLPEFKEDGIFVISGPTGSGKTTIFDAAAIAFFGETSRAKGGSDGECSFMTVGEGFSQAEVEFEAGGRVYRCSWVRRRAGLKADGDFQPAKRELVDVETGQILASNTKDIKTKLEELAKINFERFTRGVILAQGKFDAFLASDANEKGKLLANLMGGDIYKTISIKIFEKHRDAEKRRDDIKRRLEEMRGLTDEQKAALGEEIEHLTRYNKSLTELNLSGADLLARQENLRKERSLEAGLLSQKSAAAAALDKAKSALAAACSDRDGKTPALEKAKEYDVKIKGLQDEFSAVQARSEKAENAYAAVNKTYREKVEELAAQETAVARARGYIQEHSSDAALAELVPAWEERARGLSDDEKRLKADKKTLEDMQTRLEQAAAELQAAEKKAQGAEKAWQDALKLKQENRGEFDRAREGRDLAYWSGETERSASERGKLQACRKALDRWQGTQFELSDAENNIRTTSALIAAPEAIARYENAVELAEKNWAAARDLEQKKAQLASLEERRRLLVEGEACPLCGATHHPYADHLPPLEDADAKKAEQDLKEARRTCEEFMRSQTAYKERLQGLQRTADDKRGKLAAALDDLSECRQALNLSELTAETYELWKTAVEETDRDAEKRWEKAKETADALIVLERSYKELDSRARAAENRHAELVKEHALKEQEQNNLRAQMQGAQEKYAEARAAWQERLAALAAQLTEYGESAADVVRLMECMRALRRRSELYAAQLKESTEGETKLQKIKAEVEGQNERLKEAGKAAEDERNEAAERKRRLEAVQTERYGLLAPGLRPQDILDGLTRKVETANRCVNEACSASAAAEKAAADCRKRQEELAAECQSLHAELSAAARKAQAELKNRLSAAECAQAQTEAAETGGDAELNERMRALSQALDVFLGADEGEGSWSGCQKPVEALAGACGRRCGRLEQQLSDQADLAEQRRRLRKELEEADGTVKRLSVLDDMIGSAKGDKFVRIVQELTFDNLLSKSNAHLQKFSSGRYQMKRCDGEGLSIYIIDAQLGGVERAVANMSGGERFLISLSLALGLSSLSLGDATIDSLFLDEGFGTLDEDTLNTALDCLARLRNEGKLIGIISHVNKLQEKLPLVIKVVKQGDGHSIITHDSPGCRRLPSLESSLRSRKSSGKK